MVTGFPILCAFHLLAQLFLLSRTTIFPCIWLFSHPKPFLHPGRANRADSACCFTEWTMMIKCCVLEHSIQWGTCVCGKSSKANSKTTWSGCLSSSALGSGAKSQALREEVQRSWTMSSWRQRISHARARALIPEMFEMLLGWCLYDVPTKVLTSKKGTMLQKFSAPVFGGWRWGSRWCKMSSTLAVWNGQRCSARKVLSWDAECGSWRRYIPKNMTGGTLDELFWVAWKVYCDLLNWRDVNFNYIHKIKLLILQRL